MRKKNRIGEFFRPTKVKLSAWIKSILVGLVSFVILFLSLDLYQWWTYLFFPTIFREILSFTAKGLFSFTIIAAIPFFFVRRITLSFHPRKVFFLLLMAGIPLLSFFVMYIIPQGDVLNMYFFYEIMFKFYLFVFCFLFLVVVYFYYKDTGKGINIFKNLKKIIKIKKIKNYQ